MLLSKKICWSDNMTREEILKLNPNELLDFVNDYLIKGHSMKDFYLETGITRKTIKNHLRVLHVKHNRTTNQYEIQPLSNDSNTLNSKQIIEKDNHLILNEMKDLLNSINQNLINITKNTSHQKEENKNILYLNDTTKKINLYKTNEELITRNFRIYPSIFKRLKRITEDSPFQQQQIFNALLDEILNNYNY